MEQAGLVVHSNKVCLGRCALDEGQSLWDCGLVDLDDLVTNAEAAITRCRTVLVQEM
jgi:hypothetical protein